MAWVYLLIAAVFEVGWPLGFKLSDTTQYRYLWITVAIICMGMSGTFLWLAQRDIPIGTAYAVWTGIGAAGTFAVGVLLFDDAATTFRLLSAGLIVAGVIGLRLAPS